jgi:hypothetical protein
VRLAQCNRSYPGGCSQDTGHPNAYRGISKEGWASHIAASTMTSARNDNKTNQNSKNWQSDGEQSPTTPSFPFSLRYFWTCHTSPMDDHQRPGANKLSARNQSLISGFAASNRYVGGLSFSCVNVSGNALQSSNLLGCESILELHKICIHCLSFDIVE